MYNHVQSPIITPPFLLHLLALISDENICKYFLRGTCHKGAACQYKHARGGDREKSVVCKHWLRGLCKKGEHCEFLHVFNMKKMPECWFYSKYGECCNGDECLYQHIDPESKVKECPWYARGFCKHGMYIMIAFKGTMSWLLCPTFD